MNKRLSIVQVEQKANFSHQEIGKTPKKEALAEKFNHLWLENPLQFDPNRNSIERERIELTLDLIKRHLGNLEGKKGVDLGCGWGELTKKLASSGMHMDAVDISTKALERLKNSGVNNITFRQDLIPHTLLNDDHYDLVLSTELIGYLPKEERRLYISELSRLVKPDGKVVCSTAIDIYSSDAVETFTELVETEVEPLEWIASYHTYLIKLKKLFSAPKLFAAGQKNSKFRKKQRDRRGDKRGWWFQLNSSRLLSPVWNLLSNLTTPILRNLEGSTRLMHFFEKICRFLKNDAGISHIIVIGRRRPLIIPTKEELLAREPKKKKQVWE